MIGCVVMVNELTTIHGNTIVLLDRKEFEDLVINVKKSDPRRKVIDKIQRRIRKNYKMLKSYPPTIPVRVYELRRLFPDYQKRPPLWWKRMK